MRLFQFLYEQEQNPMYAWWAYELVRHAGIEIPTWVLEYLDLTVSNLWALVQMETARPEKKKKKKQKGVNPREVMKALGFIPNGVEETYIRNHWPGPTMAADTGRFNPFATAAVLPAAFNRAEAVWIYVQKGLTLQNAKMKAASDHGVTARTIDRALKQYPLDVIKGSQPSDKK